MTIRGMAPVLEVNGLIVSVKLYLIIIFWKIEIPLSSQDTSDGNKK